MKTVRQFRMQNRIIIQSIENPVTLHQATTRRRGRNVSERSTESPQKAVYNLAQRLGIDCKGIDWGFGRALAK